MAQIGQMAARRLGQQAVGRGWWTWQQQYRTRQREARMLAAAGARLARPQLAAAVALWVGEWREAERERWRAEVSADARSELDRTRLQAAQEIRAQASSSYLLWGFLLLTY